MGAVFAGRRQPERRQKDIDVRLAPTRHDGECTSQLGVQCTQRGHQSRRDTHRLGARRHLCESAVEIEEKRVGSCQ
ncbi:hypothetical protein D3C87_2108770 [compost metagenome]